MEYSHISEFCREKKIVMIIAIKSTVLVFVMKSKITKEAKTLCLSIEEEET